MLVADWRTIQHRDRIKIEVLEKSNPGEIVIDTTGSDSDDDDMYCYVSLNIEDALHLISGLKQAIVQSEIQIEDAVSNVKRYNLKTFLIDVSGKQSQVTLCTYHKAGAKALGWNPRDTKGIPDKECSLCERMQPYMPEIIKSLEI